MLQQPVSQKPIRHARRQTREASGGLQPVTSESRGGCGPQFSSESLKVSLNHLCETNSWSHLPRIREPVAFENACIAIPVQLLGRRYLLSEIQSTWVAIALRRAQQEIHHWRCATE